MLSVRIRLRTLLIALLVVFVLPLRANAEENGTYPLIFQSDADIPAYYTMSPFLVSHTIYQEDGSVYFSGSSAAQVFQLIQADAPEEAPIVAYCADPVTGIQPGAHYQRINLEDSSYFNDSTAGKLRAVLRNVYPFSEISVIQENANDWLRKRELPEIVNLQSGEAILASQIAIWKLTGGNHYTVQSLYSGVMETANSDFNLQNKEIATQNATGYTSQNIESLYTYLNNLAPIQPVSQLLSDSAITRTVYTCVEEDDGTFTTTVNVSLNLEIKETDRLTITASCGNQQESQEVAESGDYSFTFTGLENHNEVILEIHGYQHGSDVFLFDADGTRETSQTLIGYSSHHLPVYWRRTLMPFLSAASAISNET